MSLKQYDVAFAKYSTSLNIKRVPLLSWNFHSENFEIVRNGLSDTTILNKIGEEKNWITNFDLQNELLKQTVIVVTDTDLKIVFASKNIVKMNGYYPEEVIGNSPKMFQGKNTDPITSNEISLAIKNQKPFEKTVVNYCKDGSIYKCHIKGFPIFNSKGQLTNFIAFENIAA